MTGPEAHDADVDASPHEPTARQVEVFAAAIATLSIQRLPVMWDQPYSANAASAHPPELVRCNARRGVRGPIATSSCALPTSSAQCWISAAKQWDNVLSEAGVVGREDGAE